MRKKIIIELLLICLSVSLADIFFTSDPGFYKSNFIVYWIIPLIFTTIYGKKWILISLASTLVTLFATFLINFYIYEFYKRAFDIGVYLRSFPISIAVLLMLLYLLSMMLSRYTLQIETLKSRVKVLSLESLHYKRSTKALEVVNSEFESQISRSQDSISRLYNQVEKLNKLNANYILQTLLETVQQFTQAKRAIVWAYDEDHSRLKISSSIGFHGNEPGPYMDITGTVEGYVYRNNQFFSIRKIGDYQSILIHHAKDNIMTFPINVGRKVWGVLNIEDIPFEKYSRYCEQLIQIIINLTEPPLEKALDFELMVKNNDLDKFTGLPLFSQFYSLLEEKLKLCWRDNSSISIILFDLLNFEELCDTHNRADVIKLFADSLVELFNDTSHDFYFFRYKERNQIALLSTNLDQDGISFYLVRVYRNFSKNLYLLENIKVNFNISVGYATQKDQQMSPDSILTEAESLLEMSKL